MDPLTIALVLGGAAALFVSLRSRASSQATTASLNTGVGEITAAGNVGGTVSSQLSTFNKASDQKGFKAVTGAAAAGVSAGEAAAGAGASVGSSAALGAVTFGVGALIGVAALEWARHEARIKAAKSENAAMNIAVPGWQQSLLTIVAQYNSGQLTDIQTVSELKQLRQLIFNSLQRYNHTRGVNWKGGGTQPGLWGSTKYFSVKCDKHCTIGCCLFNNVMGPAISNTINLIKKTTPGQKSITIPAMQPYPTYGFKGNPSFTVTITR